MYLINNYGILFLIFIFVIVNLVYRNILNILVLIFLFLFLRNLMEDKNAIFLAYILTIIYGIYKNFHLLENFDSISKIEKPITEHKLVKKINNIINNEITNEEDIKLKHLHNMVSNNIKKFNNSNNKSNKKIKSIEINNLKKSNKANKSRKENKLNKANNSIKENSNKTNNVPEVDSIISEELINQFIEKAKQNDSVNVSKRSINIYELKPIISKIKKNKVIKISRRFLDNEPCKPLVISNDKFILDGHHRWFAKKTLIENNTNGYDNDVDDSVFSENVKVIIIDYPIQKLIGKLQEYKIKYNEKYLSKSLINLDKVKESEKEIKQLKLKLKNIEDNYNKLNSINVV